MVTLVNPLTSSFPVHSVWLIYINVLSQIQLITVNAQYHTPPYYLAPHHLIHHHSSVRSLTSLLWLGGMYPRTHEACPQVYLCSRDVLSPYSWWSCQQSGPMINHICAPHTIHILLDCYITPAIIAFLMETTRCPLLVI